jgi:hypothetical protein
MPFNIMDKEIKMKPKNGNPHAAIAVAAMASACTVAFNGCLPTPPTTLALFYQMAPTAEEDPAWIKRWVPATGDTEVILQQEADASGLNVELLTDPQPSGSVITLVRYHPPSTSFSVLVADNPDPAPRLLYTRTAHDDGTITGGQWLDWSPDGKWVAMQINRTVWLAQANGVFRYPIGTAQLEDNVIGTLHGWSEESSKIGWTREDDTLDIYYVSTGERRMFSVDRGDDESSDYRARYIWGPDWYGGMDFVMGVTEYYRNYVYFYNLAPAEPIPEDSTDNPTTEPPAADGGEIQLAALIRASSHQSGLYAQVIDADNDGDDDVIIARPIWPTDTEILLTFKDFGQVVDGSLSWSLDDSRLLVITTALTDGGEVTTTKLITLDTGTIDTLSETTAIPDMAAVIVDWSPNSRYVVQAYASGNSTFVDGLLFDTQLPATDATALPEYRKIAWAPDSGHLAVVTDETEISECSVSVVKTSDNPRSVAQVAENTSCLAFWSVPNTP